MPNELETCENRPGCSDLPTTRCEVCRPYDGGKTKEGRLYYMPELTRDEVLDAFGKLVELVIFREFSGVTDV